MRWRMRKGIQPEPCPIAVGVCYILDQLEPSEHINLLPCFEMSRMFHVSTDVVTTARTIL